VGDTGFEPVTSTVCENTRIKESGKSKGLLLWRANFSGCWVDYEE